MISSSRHSDGDEGDLELPRRSPNQRRRAQTADTLASCTSIPLTVILALSAKYLTYFESGRMRFVQKIAQEINAEASLVRGEPNGGIGVILGSITVNYRRPVTFPDTLLVGHRVQSMTPTSFVLDHMCYSFKQQKVVTTGTAAMVCYDYKNLKVREIAHVGPFGADQPSRSENGDDRGFQESARGKSEVVR